MNKVIIVEGPVETSSGYGHRAKDFVRSLLKVKPEGWDIKILSTNWGMTPKISLKPGKDDDILNLILRPGEQLTQKPEVHFQITVPNEFRPLGKFSVGVTAGIETTICDASWIEGCNRMNLILVSANHGKNVLLGTKYDKIDNNTKQVIESLSIKTPVEVLFEGVDLNIFKPEYNKSEVIEETVGKIPEKFVFLYNGAWLRGEIGQDRKNTGMLVKVFLEAFKNQENPPALLMKTSGATYSYLDEKEIKDKIKAIKKTVKGKLPNIYLFHGHVSDNEVNDLYNHPKVKCMVNFTKGEGYGRPLLEFSVTNKPIITSNWSGHTDFLKSEFSTLVGGKLEEIHESAIMDKLLVKGSQWFTIDYQQAGGVMIDMVKNYHPYEDKAKKQGYSSRNSFSFNKMTELLKQHWDKYIPEFASMQTFQLPKLNKIELPKLQLPKLNKI
jgi:hypothetical protein